ncbi:USP2 family protein [Megaselia abdita]
MPSISTQRSTSTTGGSNLFLQPTSTTSGVSETSKYSKFDKSNGYNNSSSGTSLSLNNRYSSYIPSGTTSSASTSSRYRSGSLSGGSISALNNYDSSASSTLSSSRFGVSSRSNSSSRCSYARSSSDRDLNHSYHDYTLPKRTSSFSGQNNDTLDYTSTLRTRRNSLTRRPPSLYGGCSNTSSSIFSNHHQSVVNVDSISSIKTKNNFNNNQLPPLPSSTSSSTNNKSSTLRHTPSSLARYVATSGYDLYEKYSPAHYIPKCELSRSRSLTEANVVVVNNNSNSNNNNHINSNNHNNSNHNNSSNHLSNNTHSSSSNGTASNGSTTIYVNSSEPLSPSTYNGSSSKNQNTNDDVDQANGNNHDVNNIDFNDLKISKTSINLISSSPTPPTSTLSSRRDTKDKEFSSLQLANDSKIRTTTIRTLPPSSPTASRYLDNSASTSSYKSSRKSTISESENGSPNGKTANGDGEISDEGLCGLRNIGNTCFMNSVIQCLSHTSELTKFLKSQTYIKNTTKDQQILHEFAKLIREMWTPNIGSVTPHELKSAFSSKHRMYSGYNQQDSQEFLRFFLDSLHCALNSGTKGEHLKIDDSWSDNRIADLTWEWYSKVENSIVKDLFVGQLKSTLKCTVCGNTSVTFDPFWDLSVPLPSSSRCKLDSCLDLFIREEILDGDEKPTCSKCQTRRKCTKTFTIQRFPKYLVIHLKRFSETRWSKLSNVVEFPTGDGELNMAPYAATPTSNTHYTLYAVSNHMGSTAGGHYTASCKHPYTKRWNEFNDNIVSEMSESSVVSSSAYLLFYERT